MASSTGNICPLTEKMCSSSMGKMVSLTEKILSTSMGKIVISLTRKTCSLTRKILVSATGELCSLTDERLTFMASVLGLSSPTEKGFLSAELIPGFMEATTGSAGLGKVALVRAGGAEVRPEIFGLAGRSGAVP